MEYSKSEGTFYLNLVDVNLSTSKHYTNIVKEGVVSVYNEIKSTLYVSSL
jgi:hypothetical protein